MNWNLIKDEKKHSGNFLKDKTSKKHSQIGMPF